MFFVLVVRKGVYRFIIFVSCLYLKHLFVLLQKSIFQNTMSFNPRNYQFSTGEHRDKNVILVHFPNNSLLKNELRGSNRQLGSVKSPLDDL